MISTTNKSSNNRRLSPDVTSSTLTPSKNSSSRHIFHFLSKLHHGILHFPNNNNSNNKNAISSTKDDGLNDNNDKGHYARFVFVPMGYMNRHEQSMWRILNALEITQLPPLLMTVGSSIIESSSSSNTTSTSDSDLFQLLLEETIDLCTNVGAWIIPDRPWSYDGCANSIMDTIVSYQEKKIRQIKLNDEEQNKQKNKSPSNFDDNITGRDELKGINESQQETIVQDVVTLGLLALDEVSCNPNESIIIKKACNYLNHKISGNMIPLTSTSIHNHHFHQHNHDPISIPIVTMDDDYNKDYNKTDNYISSNASTIPPAAVPCSNMRHYIIFESNEEKRSFHQKLMELVPDLLLLFDSTNNNSKFTDTTKHQIESSIYHGTPISIIRNSSNEHSSSSISPLIQMFHHIDNELEEQSKEQITHQLSDNTAIIEEVEIPIEKKQQNYHVKNYGPNKVLTTCIPPLDNNLVGNDLDMINELVETWPIEYRKEKIVIATNLFLDNNNNNVNINSTINMYLNEYRERLLIAIECSYSPSYNSIPPTENSRDIQETAESHLHQMTTIVIEKECQYCNSCLQLLKRIMIWKKVQTITIQVSLVLFTFLTVLCAVLYSKFYSNSNNNVHENDLTLPTIVVETNMTENDVANGTTLPILDVTSIVKDYIDHIMIVIMEQISNLDPIQMMIYLSTIFLPFIVSYFQKQNRHVQRHDSPMKSWYRLEIAVTKMESELIQFRAQVGTYISYTIQSQEELLSSENNSHMNNNNKETYIMDIADIAAVGKNFWGTLMMETNHIWSDVHDLITEENKRNLLQTLSRYNGKNIASLPQKKKNENNYDCDTTSTTVDDSVDSKKIVQVLIGETNNNHNDTNEEKGDVSSSPDEMTPLLLPAIGFYMEKPIKQINEPIPNAERTEMIYNPFAWEKRQYVKDFFFDYPKYNVFEEEAIESFYIVQDKIVVADSHDEKMKTSTPPTINSTTTPALADSTVLVPVYYQPTTTEEYITTRLEQQLMQRNNDITIMDNNNNFVSKLMTYLTLSTSIVAALSYQWVIPIVLGLVTAFGMNQEFQRYDAKYHNTRNIVNNLEEMKNWWYNQLSEEERELSIHKEKLITETEKIIVSYKCALHSEQS